MSENRKRVAFVGQPEYFRCTYEKDLDGLAEVREFPFNFSMTAKDFEELLGYDADVNFFFRGEFVPATTLRQLSGIKVNLSSEPFPRHINGGWEYTLDSINRYIAFREIRKKPFDFVFHYERASLDLMEWDGLKLSGDFVFPIATGTYKREERAKQWDIFFVGRSTEHRERYFGSLKHYFNFLHICHGVWGPALVEYMCRSKICLNVHAEDEVSWEPRVQMMMASGAFVISEKITPNDYLRPGIDYIEVGDRFEMFEAVKYYLKSESEREAIAASGYQRVSKLLSAESCFSKLIEDISQGACRRFEVSKGRKVLDVYAAANDQFRRLRSINFLRKGK